MQRTTKVLLEESLRNQTSILQAWRMGLHMLLSAGVSIERILKQYTTKDQFLD
jgi:hypothetical protein